MKQINNLKKPKYQKKIW